MPLPEPSLPFAPLSLGARIGFPVFRIFIPFTKRKESSHEKRIHRQINQPTFHYRGNSSALLGIHFYGFVRLRLQGFQGNITQTFFLAILGILALLAASVIVDIMYNLTIISEALAPKEATPADGNRPKRHFWVWVFIISFPLIGLLLYLGDVRTSQVKERQLLKSAQYMVENHREALDRIANYTFDTEYIRETGNALKLMSKEDENFPFGFRHFTGYHQ